MQGGSWLTVPATAARALGPAGPLWTRLVTEANLGKFVDPEVDPGRPVGELNRQQNRPAGLSPGRPAPWSRLHAVIGCAAGRRRAAVRAGRSAGRRGGRRRRRGWRPPAASTGGPSPYWARAIANSVSPRVTMCVRPWTGDRRAGGSGAGVNITVDGGTTAAAGTAAGSVSGCGAVGIRPDMSYTAGPPAAASAVAGLRGGADVGHVRPDGRRVPAGRRLAAGQGRHAASTPTAISRHRFAAIVRSSCVDSGEISDVGGAGP